MSMLHEWRSLLFHFHGRDGNLYWSLLNTDGVINLMQTCRHFRSVNIEYCGNDDCRRLMFLTTHKMILIEWHTIIFWHTDIPYVPRKLTWPRFRYRNKLCWMCRQGNVTFWNALHPHTRLFLEEATAHHSVCVCEHCQRLRLAQGVA